MVTGAPKETPGGAPRRHVARLACTARRREGPQGVMAADSVAVHLGRPSRPAPAAAAACRAPAAKAVAGQSLCASGRAVGCPWVPPHEEAAAGPGRGPSQDAQRAA